MNNQRAVTIRPHLSEKIPAITAPIANADPATIKLITLEPLQVAAAVAKEKENKLASHSNAVIRPVANIVGGPLH
jgi:hypothetical protein